MYKNVVPPDVSTYIDPLRGLVDIIVGIANVPPLYILFRLTIVSLEPVTTAVLITNEPDTAKDPVIVNVEPEANTKFVLLAFEVPFPIIQAD